MKIAYHNGKPNRKQMDSFFYEGDFATLEHKGRQVKIVAVGEIRIDDEDGLVHDGFKKRGNCTLDIECDDDFKKIDDKKYRWENNNWFDVWWLVDDAWECSMNYIAHSVDEAIGLALSMLTEEDKVKKLWEA